MVYFVTVKWKDYLAVWLLIPLLWVDYSESAPQSMLSQVKKQERLNKVREVLDFANGPPPTPYDSLRGYSYDDFPRDEGNQNKVINNVVNRRKREYIPRRGPLSPPPTQKLPDGVERVYQESQYLSSDSISFYSHKDTSSEQRAVYGNSDSSYEVDDTDPPPNLIKPHDMVQILLTKAIDPYIAYKAVAADYEMEPADRKPEWERLHFSSLSVYRALQMFKTTKEEIYQSLKQAAKLKLFTAPPKELWQTLHNYDENVDYTYVHNMWWTKTTPKKVNS